MIAVTCDTVEREIHDGRPCCVVRAYHSDRGHVPNKAEIGAVLRRLRQGEPARSPVYPNAPLRITVEGDPRFLHVEEVQILELSVGVTSFTLFVVSEEKEDLKWLIGKTLYLEPVRGEFNTSEKPASPVKVFARAENSRR